MMYAISASVVLYRSGSNLDRYDLRGVVSEIPVVVGAGWVHAVEFGDWRRGCLVVVRHSDLVQSAEAVGCSLWL